MNKGLSRRLAVTLGAILALGLSASVSMAQLATFCAEVKLEILQEATLEREAFDASLKVNNNLPDSPLTDLRVNIFVKDEEGNPADSVFFVKIATLTNTNAIDGSGVVQSSTTAEIRWLIIPSTGAGGILPGGKRYSVKATINGTSAGAAQSVTTFDDFITVYPQPSLKLEYVLPYEVFGDEPLTTGIEPIEPFPLGVRVTNIGYGTAKNFKIESAQPKIVDNKQALPVDFKLLGTVVGGTTIPDTLLVPFGDIPAQGVGQASWIMTTSLSGRFVEFTSTFTHAAELGGQLTSLIQSVTTYTLLRDVLVDLPGRDATPDFLVNATMDRGEMQALLDAGGQPDAELILESDQAVPLAVIEVPSTLSGTLGGSNATLTMTFSQGVSSNIWIHSSVPFNKTPGLVLQSARASDGRTLGAKNVWLSKHFKKDDLTVHYRLNILDLTSGASSYSINFDPAALDAAPGGVTDLVAMTAAEGGTVNLTWSAPGEDGYTGHILGGRYMIENKIDLSTPFAPAFAQVNFATSTDPGDAESYALGGLIGNATTYLVLWTQDTGGGISEISNSATAYTLPNPPRDLVLTDVSSVSAHAAWQAGNNSLPIEYQVFAATAADGVAVSSSPYLDSFSREFDFAGLAPSTTYTVFGAARNPDTGVMSPLATLGQFMTSPSPDTTPPVTELQLNGVSVATAALVAISTDTWGFIATDAESGVARTLYSLDGATETVYVSTFTLAYGTHTLAFRSEDLAGNFEALQQSSITVSAAMYALASADGGAAIFSPRSDTTITAVSTDTAASAYEVAVASQGLILATSAFYELLPSPAVFDPPALLSLRFSPVALDTATASIYRFDGVAWDSAPVTGQQLTDIGDGLLEISGTLQSASLYAVFALPPTLVSIEVTPSSASIAAGTTLQFEAMGTFTDSSTRTLTGEVAWSTDISSMVSVSTTGAATGLLEGTALIIASSGTITAQAVLTVTPATLVSIEVMPSTASIAMGTTLQFEATGTFTDASTRTLTGEVAWSTDVSSTVAVSTTGAATGLFEGTAAISASSGAVTGQVVLTVTPAALVSIEVTPSTTSIAMGTTAQFEAMGTFTDASTRTLTGEVAWTTDVSSVATVDASGLAIGVGEGAALVIASSGAVTAQADLTVTPATLVSIEVTPSSATTAAGLTAQFEAMGTFTDASTRTLTGEVAWTTDLSTVATVDVNGLATGLIEGTAQVNASSGTITAFAELTVTAPTLVSIDVTPSSATISAGLTAQFEATGAFTDLSTRTLTGEVAWTTDLSTVANVNASGLATGVGEGIALVIASSGTIAAEAVLTVTPATLVSIEVTPSSASIAAGLTAKFEATGTFTDLSTRTLTGEIAWATDLSTVASVDVNGLATGLVEGTVQVSASSGTISAFAELTVTAPTLVSIAVAPATASIPAGITAQFDATGTFTDLSTRALTSEVAWTTDLSTVASIDVNGLATGLVEGTVQVSASSGTVTAFAELTVTAPTLVSINVAPSSATIAAGLTTQFEATGTFTDLSTRTLNGEVSWSTDASTVAVVSAAGLATGVGEGTALVIASSGTITAQAVLTVTPATLVSIEVTPPSASIAAGLTAQFEAAGTFTDGSTRTLTGEVAWSTDLSSVATVNASGLATGVGEGSALVIASSGTITAQAVLMVTPATLVSIAVTPASASIAAGLTAQFEAAGTFTDASTRTMTGELAWSTDTSSVATVGASGLATGVGEGSALVIASSGTITAQAVLTVTPSTLVSIAVTPLSASISAGLTAQFEATGTFTDASTRTLTGEVAWTTDLSTVATVDVIGLATGVGEGSALVIASSGAITAQAVLTVTPATLVSITVTPTSASIAAGLTAQFAAAGTFTDGSTRTLTGEVAWSTDASSVATVSSAGLATGVGEGSALVIASSGAITAQAVLTVTPATLVSITVTPTSPSIAAGLTAQFAAAGTFTDGSTRTLTGEVAWSTDASSVATVSSAGLATGVGEGTALVIVSSGAITAQAVLTVTPATLVSIAVTPASASITAGTAAQFEAAGTFTDGSTRTLTGEVSWSADASSVAAVSASGLATGVSEGTALVIASSGAITAQATLTVTAPVLVSIAVTPSATSIAAGMTAQFEAAGTFTDGSTRTLTGEVAWSTDVSSVATVNTSGLATAAGEGTTLVIASSGAITTQSVLIVTPPTLVSIAVTPPSASIAAGLTAQFAAAGTFTDGSTRTLTGEVAWSTDVSSVATVDASGLATGVDEGTALVLASSGAATAQAVLTVTTPALVSVAVTPGSASISAGSSLQFEAAGTFTNGSTRALTGEVLWTTDVSSVATISASGLATGEGEGSAVVLASSGALVGQASLTVNATYFLAVSADGAASLASSRADATVTAVSSVSVAAAYAAATGQGLILMMPSLYELQPSPVVFDPAALLSFTFDPASIDTHTIAIYRYDDPQWSTSPIAGQTLELLEPSSARVSGYLSGASLYAVFSLPATPVLASIEVTPATASIEAGTALQFAAAGTFTDGSTRTMTAEVVWSTDVSSVATVNAGLATGVGGGAAQVIASSGAITGYAALTVTVPPLTVASIAPSSAEEGTSVSAALVGTGFDASAALSLERTTIAQGTWTATGSFGQGRHFSALTRLPDGRALLAGGMIEGQSVGLPHADVYDPATGAWTAAAPMNVGRFQHAAVPLADGRVLVTGGQGPAGGVVGTAEIYDPATGAWAAAAPMANVRKGHRTERLPDGRVLAVGGYDGSNMLTSAELYDPASNSWSPAASMSAARLFPGTAVLADGKVLVAGGRDLSSNHASAAIYDPATNAWTATGSMAVARQEHMTTTLPGGKVLVSGGGSDSGITATAETYDPASGTWTPTAPMAYARLSHAMVAAGGTAMVIGGQNSSTDWAATEVYDAATNAWRLGPSLTGTRTLASAMTLDDGKVLVAAGRRGLAGGTSLNSSELLTAPELQIVATSVAVADQEHLSGSLSLAGAATGYWDAVVRQSGGRIGRLAGGFKVLPGVPALVSIAVTPATASIEVDSAAQFAAAGTFADGSTRTLTGEVAWSTDVSSVATVNASGLATGVGGGAARVIASSGSISSFASLTVTLGPLTLASITPESAATGQTVQAALTGTGFDAATALTLERADALNGTWAAAGAFAQGRYLGTLTKLGDGRVLLAGGVGGPSAADIYNPATGAWTAAPALIQGRDQHAAVALADGRVLVSGGYASGAPVNSAEIYDPALGAWTAAASMNAVRAWHQMTLLSDGRILAAGGTNGPGYLSSTEIYDPVANTWTPAASMSVGHSGAAMATLSGGKILVAGGFGGNLTGEVYDPTTNAWTTATGALQASGYYLQAVRLSNGKVVIAGDPGGTTDLYDPATNALTAAAPLGTARYVHAMARVDGTALVIGGENSTALASTEFYDAAAGVWRPGPALTAPRTWLRGAVLDDGRVLVAGGLASVGGTRLNTAELLGEPAAVIAATGEAAADSQHLTGTLVLSGAATGYWDVVVRRTDGKSARLDGGFQISTAPAQTDFDAPVVTLSFSTPAYFSAGGLVTIGTHSLISLQAVDPSSSSPASGVAQILYAVDATTPNVTYTAPFTLAAGAHTVYFSATDVAGNASEISSAALSAAESPFVGVFSPSSGAIGIAYSMAGFGFGTYGGANTQVRFGPSTSPVSVWNDASIVGTVPGLSTGAHAVTLERLWGSTLTISAAGTYTVTPLVPTLSVATGPIGLPFTLTGPGFGTFLGANSRVLFAGATAPISVWNDATISGTIPGVADGTTTMVVERQTADGFVARSEPLPFTVTLPSVTAVSPSSAPIGGGFALTGWSFGNYLGTNTQVLIGGATTPVSVWNDATIVGTVPGALPPGEHELVVERRTADGFSARSASVPFTVVGLWIEAISPSTGAIGIPFTVTGTGFGSYLGANSRVMFGVSTAAVSVWTDGSISGTIPTLATGAYAVTVERQQGADVSVSNASTFTVISPEIASVAPSSGPIGTVFTLSGTGFGPFTGANTFLLLGGATTPITVWNDTTITATVPGSLTQGVHELVAVRRNADGGLSVSNTAYFEVTALSIASMSPSTGAIGIPFTISGSEFGVYLGANSRVRFGVSTAAVSVWNNTTISGTVPTLATGAYAVTVERQQGEDVSVSNAFTFTVISPEISSVTPSSGPIGTVFTLSGAGFGPFAGVNTFLLLDGATTPISVWNDSTITATVPGGLTTGVKELTAVRRNADGGLSASNTTYFEVTGMSIASINPSTGPIGIPFTIKGSQFGAYLGANSRVRFGVSTAAVSVWNDTTISGTLPALSTGAHAVVIERQQGTDVTFSEPSSFTVTDLAVGTLTPSSGPIGVPFTITGEHFGPFAGTNTRLLLGGATVAVSVWNDTTITGTVPHLEAGSQPLWLERKSGTGVQSSATTYFLVTTPLVASMVPSSAPIGAPFTLNGTSFGVYGGANTRVKFNGVVAAVSLWNDVKIVGTVPGAVSTGTAALVVERAVGAEVASSAVQDFEVLRPEISSVTPGYGPAGTVVSLTGHGFGPYGGTATQLLVGGSTVSVSVWNDSTIRWTVTAAFSNGDYPLVVRRSPVGGSIDSEPASFTVGTGYGGASFGFSEPLSLAAQPDINFEGGLNLPVDEGGRVETASKAAVDVPANALEEDTEITLRRLRPDGLRTEAAGEDKKRAAGEAIEFGPAGTLFKTPVTIELPYDPALAGDESLLAVHYYNPLRRAWEELPSVVDRTRRVVRAQTAHFSIYQPMGGLAPQTAAQDEFYFRDQYAFPNPSRGGAVTFRIQPGLADTIELRVYDLSGRRVHSSTDFTFRGAIDDLNGKGAQNTYDHVWGVSGVGSGVYNYVIKASRAGSSPIVKKGKVGVIK